MSITIGSASFPTLTAQPFGYEESNVRAGRTARRWQLAGLLKPSEWLTLLTAYDTWRDLRIEDEDTLKSGVVGRTVSFSGKGPGGQTWTNVPCWFIAAPQADATGAYLSVSASLVDAAQALQVLLKEQDAAADEEDLDLGTITIGSTTLKLLKPVDAYSGSPSLDLTPSGVHVISGPLVPFRVKDVEGRTNLAGWNDIRSWYEGRIGQVPAVGSLFPIGPPSASAEARIVEGVRVTSYNVSIQLGEIR
jgi:hypothetical protein